MVSLGFPGHYGGRGETQPTGWGRGDRGQRLSPAARQPELAHTGHQNKLCSVDGPWELPVGNADLDKAIKASLRSAAHNTDFQSRLNPLLRVSDFSPLSIFQINSHGKNWKTNHRRVLKI